MGARVVLLGGLIAAMLPASAGADVAFRSATGAANATASTLVLTRPTAVQAGDVLLATVDARGNPSITPPSGWTLVRADTSSTTQVKSTYSRVATASEPASWTFTLSAAQAASGAVLDYTGVDTTTPVDVSGATVSTNWGSSTQTAPSVTTTAANEVVVSLFGTSNAASAVPGSGLTERADAASTAGSFAVDTEAADRVLASAGATGTSTATSNVTGASISQTVALRAAASPAGPQWFAPNSFWNVPLPSSPALDTNSSTMVTALVGQKASAHIVNDTDWGYPVVTATTSDPSYSMNGTIYPGPSAVTCRVPTTATANGGSDGHLTVIQPDGTTCDFWVFSRTSGGVPQAGTVAKSCGRVTGPNRDAWGTVPCRGSLGNGAVGAGFDMIGGIVRPEEIDGSAPIPHALVIALPASIVRNDVVWPATHTDGACTSTTGCIPEGAKIQLDPSVNVAALSLDPWQKKIAVALQTYGAYVADRSGSFEVRAEERGNDAVWTSRSVPIDGSLSSLPWSSVRVVQTTAAPSTVPSWWTGG